VAGHRGVEVLPPVPITADDLRAVAAAEGVSIPENGAVLIRSGWARLWGNPEAYLGRASGVPGPDVSAAEWLGEMKVKVTAHDSMAYEHMMPGIGPACEPVHPILLVKHGIHILENINLEELAASRIFEFLFVCLPLKLVGATGSPVRPIAIAFSS
jgi:kynurenine formamidase